MSAAPRPCTTPSSVRPGMFPWAGTVSRCPASSTSGRSPRSVTPASTHVSPASRTGTPASRRTARTCALSAASLRDSDGTSISSRVLAARRAARSVGTGETVSGRACGASRPARGPWTGTSRPARGPYNGVTCRTAAATDARPRRHGPAPSARGAPSSARSASPRSKRATIWPSCASCCARPASLSWGRSSSTATSRTRTRISAPASSRRSRRRRRRRTRTSSRVTTS